MESEQQQFKREHVSIPIKRVITVLNTLPFLSEEDKGATLAFYCWTKDPDVKQKGIKALDYDAAFVNQSIDHVHSSPQIEEIFSGIDRISEDRDMFRDYMKHYRSIMPKPEKPKMPRKPKVERIKSPTIYERFSDAIVDLRNQHLTRDQIADSLNITINNVDYVISTLLQEGRLERAKRQRTDKPTKPISKVQIREDLIKQMFDEAVAKGDMLPTNQKIKNALENYLGREVSMPTIQRSVSRLLTHNDLPARRRHQEATELDVKVKDLYIDGQSINKIAQRLGASIPRIRGSVTRLHEAREVQLRQEPGSGVRASLIKYFEDHLQHNPDGRINLSDVARQFGVSRERVRQLYNRLKDNTHLPPKENRSRDKQNEITEKILTYGEMHPGEVINLADVARDSGVTTAWAGEIYRRLKPQQEANLPPLLTQQERGRLNKGKRKSP